MRRFGRHDARAAAASHSARLRPPARAVWRGALGAAPPRCEHRRDSPELAYALPKTPLTFDAELAPGLLGELYAEVGVERWDAPLLELPSQAAVGDYLVGNGVDPEEAKAAETTEVPLWVTKRGALAFARKA